MKRPTASVFAITAAVVLAGKAGKPAFRLAMLGTRHLQEIS